MASIFTPTDFNQALGPYMIDSEDCIGDSVGIINANTNYLASKDNELSTRIDSVSGVIKQVETTVLFVPANYSTFSNANPYIGSPAENTWSGPGTKTFSDAWWSGIQTATVPNCPTNTVAVLLHVWANCDAYANNKQYVYFYKDDEETAANLPSASTTSSDITKTAADNITSDYRKIEISPIQSGSKEGEAHVTVPIYIDTATNQFKYFWVDTKNTATPTSDPAYYLRLTVLGYYVSVV